MNDTKLVFVVGSGRCGTKMIKSLLAGVKHIEARHEYVRNAYQRDAMLYAIGLMTPRGAPRGPIPSPEWPKPWWRRVSRR